MDFHILSSITKFGNNYIWNTVFLLFSGWTVTIKHFGKSLGHRKGQFSPPQSHSWQWKNTFKRRHWQRQWHNPWFENSSGGKKIFMFFCFFFFASRQKVLKKWFRGLELFFMIVKAINTILQSSSSRVTPLGY